MPIVVSGQFVDDFSDGDFTHNPPWVGDHEKFVVEAGVLKLAADDAGMAYLSTQSAAMSNTQWDFWVRIAFTPSDNNHPRIYLCSNSSDLTAPLNGYFLQIGKTGGDNKRLYFYRQDGLSATQLLAGTTNLAAATNNIIRIRVLRDGIGNWQLFADPAGGNMFIPQGEAFDPVHNTTIWFGVRCTYTVSNNKRFFFDDFYVGDIIPEDPPTPERVVVTAPNTLELTFNRMITRETAIDVHNYFVDGGIMHPLVIAFDEQVPNKVSLLFFQSFQPNHLYQLDVSGIKSPDGQVMDPWQGEFVHYISARFDVVFNELMVNSRPEVALPPHDWLELYNTTGLPLNLAGWVLQHANARRTIPDAVIPPKGYLVLTTEAAHPYLAPYGNVIAVPGLTANALTIGGTDLVLWDNKDNLVAFVSYTGNWYGDPAKANGGWSLEKIDPYNFCEGARNWTASRDMRGGSPGEANSVLADNPDITPPGLLHVTLKDSLNIRIHFSEPMEEAPLWMVQNYFVDMGVGHPQSVTPITPDFTTVDLTLNVPLEAGLIYTLEVSASLTDCAGNAIGRRTGRMALPAEPSGFDVVINEVLFNPPDQGARYVELYNRSQHVVDLAGMLLASKDTLEHTLITLQPVSEDGRLLFPGEYVVLTNDTAAVKKSFSTPDPYAFVQLAAMPRMTNASGIVVLATKGHMVIDQLIYDEDMHLPLLVTTKGVALERIHPDRPTHSRSNWHSAAAAAGYGTPGYQNSQYLSNNQTGNDQFEAIPRIFAPDGSGSQDVLNIHYAMHEPGYIANVRIFDSRGRQVRFLKKGKLLAMEGVITWDGTTCNRLKAPVGVYIIHVETFNQHGDVKHHKITAVLAAQL